MNSLVSRHNFTVSYLTAAFNIVSPPEGVVATCGATRKLHRLPMGFYGNPVVCENTIREPQAAGSPHLQGGHRTVCVLKRTARHDYGRLSKEPDALVQARLIARQTCVGQVDR